jgi:enoyl-CoA hydratase
MDVAVDRVGAVAVVRLSAPQRRNALTVEMAQELIRAFDGIDAAPSIGAVVIKGEGKGFCAGADLSTLGDAGDDPASTESYNGLSTIYASFTRLGQLAAPVIAAVHGAAVGAGLNLAMAADLRIVARDSRLISGFVRIGAHPGGGHFVLLSRLVGREAATAMAIFDEEIDGVEAERRGLAWRAVAAEDVDAVALELALRVAAKPALARMAIRTLRTELGPPAVGWDVAVQAEKAPQMWSLRQRAK